MKLFCKFFCTSLQCLINTGRILAACLSHIRTATAAAANKLSHCFDQIAGMCALLHGTVCCHSKKALYIAVDQTARQSSMLSANSAVRRPSPFSQERNERTVLPTRAYCWKVMSRP